jgi:hypothetical protein
MRFNQYILSEGRGKPLKKAMALEYIKTHCKKALEEYYKGHIIYRGIDNTDIASAFEITGKSTTPRKSANTTNHYTLLIDNLPSWRGFPKRSQSIICSTSNDKASMYGEVFVVFPIDGAKIGICPEDDIFFSFKFMKGETMRTFNNSINNIMELVSGLKLGNTDASWAVMMKYFKGIDDVMKPLSADERKEMTSRIFGAKIVLDGYDPEKGIFVHLNEVMAPRENNFRLIQSGGVIPYDKEVWIEDKCILIDEYMIKTSTKEKRLELK